MERSENVALYMADNEIFRLLGGLGITILIVSSANTGVCGQPIIRGPFLASPYFYSFLIFPKQAQPEAVLIRFLIIASESRQPTCLDLLRLA